MKKIIPTLALIVLTVPLFGSIANAQTTSQTTSTPPATTAAKPPMQRLVTSSNSLFQRTNRSTELANPPQGAATAWDTISNDASFTEFASLVTSAGLENLFSRVDGTWTYVIPTNDAFSVLEQTQLARLKEPRFKDQAAAIVRQHVMNGRFTFADFTRRLPTGLPPTLPTIQTSCSTVSGTLVNGVTIGGAVYCSTFTIPVPIPAPPVDTIATESGKNMSVRTSVVRSASGQNHFRVTIGSGGSIESADFGVKNGVLHTTDTLQIPSGLGSMTDIVGRY